MHKKSLTYAFFKAQPLSKSLYTHNLYTDKIYKREKMTTIVFQKKNNLKIAVYLLKEF